MNENSLCLLHTRDADLVQRVKVYMPPAIDLKHVESAGMLLRSLEQHGPSIVLLDVRGTTTLDLLREIGKRWPENVIVAMGAPRSDPLMEALDIGVYASHELDFDGPAFETLVRQAAHHLQLSDEVAMLREQLGADRSRQSGLERTDRVRRPNLQMRQFFQPLRHFDDITGMLRGMVDGIASEAGTLRVGIFAGSSLDSDFSMMAGVGCLDDARELKISRDDALVRWLEVNAQIVTRENLGRLHVLRDRKLLERTLDTLGAELIIPMHGRSQILGWLFLGRRATGRPYDDSALQALLMYAEHAATALENAMLYHEISLQKSFAETLLHSLPTGIIAADEDEHVGWFNESAERMLQLDRREVMGLNIDALGNPVAEQLRLALRGQVREYDLFEWEDSRSSRYFCVQTARLISDERCWGAVAFVHDMTRERHLNQKQRELEEAEFWTDLAASMSHEIRNPLVAIKTFAQLLPERYSDPEFREKFSALMSDEVDRLDAVIKEINRFASAPKYELKDISLNEVLDNAVREADVRQPSRAVNITLDIPPDLPKIHGDRQALCDAFAHLIVNSVEALKGQPDATVTIRAAAPSSESDEAVVVTVSDNGSGIETEIREKVFSPFCTTKTRAMGLGLPIVKRTISEHKGQVEIESGKQGTSVKISLPVERIPEAQTV